MTSARPDLPASLAHRLPADVAAAKSFRPLDAIDRLIGAALRFGDGLADRADIQHAPAIGENGAVLCDRAGVEDFDALDFGCVVEPFDRGALVVIAGIAFRGHHHRQRGIVEPAQS